MELEQFAELVERAVASLPDEITAYMDNVSVSVADWPTRSELREAGLRRGTTLLGLYQGIPLTGRGENYNLVTPDQIIIYRGPIEHFYRTDSAIIAQVRRTVIHEIGHHFGIDDERLEELGAY